jgi:hypothetical protein
MIDGKEPHHKATRLRREWPRNPLGGPPVSQSGSGPGIVHKRAGKEKLMRRMVLMAVVLLNCASFGTELFAQAGQTVNPVPITPPSVNTATTTCQINCDTQAMFCQNSCVPTTGTVVVNPALPAGATSTCTLSCTTQQLVCKQRC